MQGNRPYRIAIVNDLALAREVLKIAVQSRPHCEIAWVAEDGLAAVKFAERDTPDVILMDLVMPGMDGVEATRQIMAKSPCQILLVTASVTGNFNKVMQAMSHGGLDAVPTPSLDPKGQLVDAEHLHAKLDKLLAQRHKLVPAKKSQASSSHEGDTTNVPLVAIGASTGGPLALGAVLSRLPKNFPGCVLIVQHMDAAFMQNFIRTLQDSSPLPVQACPDVGSVFPGQVLVAATNDHMILNQMRKLVYVKEPVNYPYRPSVDALFMSLSAHWPKPGVAVLLTGMGDDGAKGMLALRKKGWLTIAQDQATSVVYGMPQKAKELGAASRISPIDEVAINILSGINFKSSSSQG